MPDTEPTQALARELEATFGPHLEALCARTARALESGGFTGLLVHSGSALRVFEDDRTYPFLAHAPFKVWVPLADVPDSYIWFRPGSKPMLVLHQPRDYWYKPADLPRGY
jgi:Xaa-Pro dipeptidase